MNFQSIGDSGPNTGKWDVLISVMIGADMMGGRLCLCAVQHYDAMIVEVLH